MKNILTFLLLALVVCTNINPLFAQWVRTKGLSNSQVTFLVLSGRNLFAGTDGGVYLSSNDGTNGRAANFGLTNTKVRCLAVSDTSLYAGTIGASGWARPLSEMITSVRDRRKNLRARFSLQQNYPNPFNPSIIISYQLPAASHVTLGIYDVHGREPATLANENEAAGYKSVTFDASELSSGVCFYRLVAESYGQAGSYRDTKMLVLLR